MNALPKFIPIINFDGAFIPHAESLLLPNKRNEKILSKLARKVDKFIIVDAKDDNFASMSDEDIKNLPAVIASVSDRIEFPDGSTRYVVVIEERANIIELTRNVDMVSSLSEPEQGTEQSVSAICIPAPVVVLEHASEEDLEIMKELRVKVIDAFVMYSKSKDRAGNFSEKLSAVRSEKDFGTCCDLIACLMDLNVEQRREYLKIKDYKELATQILSFVEHVIYKDKIIDEITLKARRSIDLGQKAYFLREQMKAVRDELEKTKKLAQKNESGSSDLVSADDESVDEDELTEIEKLYRAIDKSKMPSAIAKSLKKEIKRCDPFAGGPEAQTVRNYVDTVLGLPWGKRSKVNKNLSKASEILEADHYGLEKVKERILEYLAVQTRSDRLNAPIICLVGPPGVGKTSLGRSIAKATGRNYVRVALGGLHDESEIRGHRRTYIGSMPGRIIEKISKVGVLNPLFLLDEIDKISFDGIHGDPAAALLEVLDPEQNNTFTDNYLGFEFDLSDVMFMATSNSRNIPPALADRMEIITLSSYTEDEKLHIAKRHLIPKEFEKNNVAKGEVIITDDALLGLIRTYTSEAGVRGLERIIGRLCRKAVKEILLSKGEVTSITFNNEVLPKYLGPRIFDHDKASEKNRVGVVNGLAYTTVGGEILNIEAVTMIGNGQNSATGKLGTVMKESVQAALALVRARCEDLRIAPESFKNRDLHLHFPEGAVPKDGPSAGIAICTAITSAFTGNPVRSDVAMTGEITLRGEVLPIGGLKEKLFAALRGKIKKVLIPKDNVKDLDEVPDTIKNGLEIVPVSTIEEVFEHALEYPTDKVKLPKKKKKTTKNADLEHKIELLTKLLLGLNEEVQKTKESVE